MKLEQSVLKHQHIQFRCWGIMQKKEYNKIKLYLNINQLDAPNFIMSLFHASTCFEHVLIVRRSKLYYIASGIITPIGGCPVHRLREDFQPVHGTATYRCDDTRGCIVQF